MRNINMHISEKIKFIRTKILNVSAQKFADMCGVTARTVYAWESGVSLPCLDNIVAIANTCHASLDYLLIVDHEFELCFPNLDDETFKCISHLTNKMKEENEVNQISNTVE